MSKRNDYLAEGGKLNNVRLRYTAFNCGRNIKTYRMLKRLINRPSKPKAILLVTSDHISPEKLAEFKEKWRQQIADVYNVPTICSIDWIKLQTQDNDNKH